MKRLVTLVVLTWFTFVLSRMGPPVSEGPLAALLLGFVLIGSYLSGFVASRIGLPRVTGYVLFGVLVGPFALGVLNLETALALRTIDDLALGLIALTAGGELRISSLRRMIHSILGISLSIMIVTIIGIMALVLVARPFLPFLAELSLGGAIGVALLLGIWCANSSPDVTVAVINESGARGEVTDTILSVTIFKDVLVIISFAVALSITATLVNPDAAFDTGQLAAMTWEVGGALLVGGAAGYAFATYLGAVPRRRVLSTLVFTFLLILIAYALHLELLLTAVGAGFVIENFSEVGESLIHAVEANALAVFAIFFAIAGASLDLGALVRFWPMAAAVVALRLLTTWGGARMGARLSGVSPAVRQHTWFGLISQAGVTLGLSLVVGRELPGIGSYFVSITAAIIIFHLLLGPILLKLALTRAGETGVRDLADGAQPAPAHGQPAPAGA
ncbi:MAG TPA: cation:proton antiporter [Longimicrobiales bacterium]|nr:cation:proton antiporter [Longimicrobiales bacterium]